VTSPRSAIASIATDPGLAYLDSLRESLVRAGAAAGGFAEEDLYVAGLRVRLRFAGEEIRDILLPPYEHLAAGGPGKPELSIDVFDSASTGVRPAALPWSAPDPGEATNPILRYQSDRACVVAEAAMGVLSAADPANGEAVLHLRDVGALQHGERAVPLRDALQLLLGERERWLIHAGAAGRDGIGALLVGHSGSGKSTLALSCALAGMEVVSDDYVVLEVSAPPTAHAMQSTAKVSADSAARLRLPEAAMDAAGFEPTPEGPAKAVVDLRFLAPGAIRRSLTVGALVAPMVSDPPRPALEQISPARSLQALAPSTVLQDKSRSPELLAAMGRLVREVPSYALRLGPEPNANAESIAKVVDDLG
jgi:hypothetical protein